MNLWKELEFAAAAATCFFFPNPPVGKLPDKRQLSARFHWPGHQRSSTRPGIALTVVADGAGNVPPGLLEFVDDFDRDAMLSAIDECYAIAERRRKESRQMADQAQHELNLLRKTVEFGLLAGIVPENYAGTLEDNDWLGVAVMFIVVEQVRRLSAKARGAWPIFMVWSDAYMLPYTNAELLLHFRGDDYPSRTAFRFDITRPPVYEIIYHPPLGTPSGILDVLGRLGLLLASDEPPEYADPVTAIGSSDWPRWYEW
jgi:hypothetical protein